MEDVVLQIKKKKWTCSEANRQPVDHQRSRAGYQEIRLEAGEDGNYENSGVKSGLTQRRTGTVGGHWPCSGRAQDDGDDVLLLLTISRRKKIAVIGNDDLIFTA